MPPPPANARIAGQALQNPVQQNLHQTHQSQVECSQSKPLAAPLQERINIQVNAIKKLVKIWWRSGMRSSILCRAFVSIHSQTPSFARSLIARPPSSSASSNRDVSFPIFKQCIILQSLDAEEMSGVVGNDFQPVGSLFHKKYHSESDFNNAFFNHVDPIIRKARVR
jgi:hypothetical protein